MEQSSASGNAVTWDMCAGVRPDAWSAFVSVCVGGLCWMVLTVYVKTLGYSAKYKFVAKTLFYAND